MKKYITRLMAMVLTLAAIFTLFAVPASAAEGKEIFSDSKGMITASEVAGEETVTVSDGAVTMYTLKTGTILSTYITSAPYLELLKATSAGSGAYKTDWKTTLRFESGDTVLGSEHVGIWYLGAEFGDRIIMNIVSGDGSGTETKQPNEDTEIKEYTITFDPNGGTVSPTTLQTRDHRLPYLPTPTREGWEFIGWWAKNGGKQYTESSTFSSDATVYAQWKRQMKSYTVYFDINCSDAQISKKTVKTDDTSGRIFSFPTAKRNGYKLDGWYTSPTGGTKISGSTTFYEDSTVYAHWTASDDSSVSSDEFYIDANGVLVDYSGDGGDVVIPHGVTQIDERAFAQRTNIKSITIPDSVKEIGSYAFYKNTNLKTVTFPEEDKAAETLKSIDYYDIFYGCKSLEKIVNCPDESVYERLNTNERLRAAWTNPEACITAQSERITALSNQICAGENTDYAKAKAVFDWVTANIEYDYEYFYGRKSTVSIFAEDVLDSKLAVCEGYTRLTQALLQAQNIPALAVSGKANGVVGWDGHAWNLAFVDGRWIYIDSTWGRPERSSYDPAWFDPTPLYVSLSHVAERSVSKPKMLFFRDYTPYPAKTATATPTRAAVLVNGEAVAFDAYNINGNNYFKLRDLAMTISGTGKQFEVTWNDSKKAINMVSGKPYTVIGGEMAAGSNENKTAQINTSIIYLDGQPVQLTAYNIGGNNYFKLRDIGTTFDFDVSWDGANNTIIIDTSKSYTDD